MRSLLLLLGLVMSAWQAQAPQGEPRPREFAWLLPERLVAI